MVYQIDRWEEITKIEIRRSRLSCLFLNERLKTSILGKEMYTFNTMVTFSIAFHVGINTIIK